MDIRIGLSDSPRELAVSSSETQEDVLARVNTAIAEGHPTLVLEDEKGRKFLLRTDRVAYVEVGNSSARSVGFAR
ncbi:DUF3107 domain-containing protein [Corynebacterium qintianiae]|uniref:DUF3107 domain-containing protein n=1 Tax=Corynebacterium qintianiae TaxID=2709392 RepID=A0A7T0KPM9_9CORY|nr:DUF3107 domain-containing protein [Corynebacterium qintianiae]QPK83718.1 DUF3107 domain-containing protein [Corynebacterium qintianiae]